MKYVDEFRDPELARRLIEQIRGRASRCWTLMEVCGGQTHSLLRFGIEEALHGTIELLHGPGCPVCVTPVETLDLAQEIALRPGVVLTSFGDMLRVPGSRRSLLDVRAAGGDVRAVYSPLDAVDFARREPQRQVVFLAVGFETTAPATALAVLQAAEHQLDNFSLLVSHVRVLPAMDALMQSPECRVQGFLAAGHVCTVTGLAGYRELAARYGTPVVVAGFEPLDLLQAIGQCIEQLESGRCEVANAYGRSVQPEGNPAAQAVIDRVYTIADQAWRGMGVIPGGGLTLRPRWRRFDARARFGEPAPSASVDDRCLSGDVLTGRIKPPACPHFGTACTPEHPLGAPMVSSEGACAAWFRYARPQARAGLS